MKFLHNFFFNRVVIAMFINASTLEFTPTHLVTFSISRTRIRMKLNSFMDEMFVNELIVKYKVDTCHYICSNYVM